MQSPDKILDLIEATEISAERLNYKLSEHQQILLTRLKSKANKGMKVSNNYWELLCDLYNEVEGRKRPDSFEDGFSSTKMLVMYLGIPCLILLFFFLIALAYMLGGK
jgi:hypothetical protein